MTTHVGDRSSAGSRNELRDRAVLVTGASGFIGAHLCAALVARGADVHAVSRQSRSAAAVRWHQADLADFESVSRLCDRVEPEFIFHLASYVAGTRDPSAVVPMLHANCLSAVNLLSVANARGVRRLVLAGSLEEPGAGEAPSSPYAAAKGAASSYASMFHKLYSTAVVCARIYMVYGPNQPDRSKLIPHVLLSLLRGQKPKLSSGKRQVDWIYVEDVVEGLIALGTTTGIDGRTLDVGSGALRSIAEVVQELYELVAPGERPPLGTLADRPFETERVADVEEMERATGWTAQVSLSEGLRRTVDWYRLHAART